MPQLPAPLSATPRRARRSAAALTAVALLLPAVAGCAKFDAALGEQEAVVAFKNGTSNATRLKVRAACSHVPQAFPEPLPTDHLASDLLNDVRYRIDNASDADIAKLQVCLQKFPSVEGVDIETPDGS